MCVSLLTEGSPFPVCNVAHDHSRVTYEYRADSVKPNCLATKVCLNTSHVLTFRQLCNTNALKIAPDFVTISIRLLFTVLPVVFVVVSKNFSSSVGHSPDVLLQSATGLSPDADQLAHILTLVLYI
jgi:hypothetical protein